MSGGTWMSGTRDIETFVKEFERLLFMKDATPGQIINDVLKLRAKQLDVPSVGPTDLDLQEWGQALKDLHEVKTCMYRWEDTGLKTHSCDEWAERLVYGWGPHEPKYYVCKGHVGWAVEETELRAPGLQVMVTKEVYD